MRVCALCTSLPSAGLEESEGGAHQAGLFKARQDRWERDGVIQHPQQLWGKDVLGRSSEDRLLGPRI